MLVFNEGYPRSGKSYDCMKFHILPALKAGRKVYARLNGLNDPVRREKIAAYLKISVERLDELLIHVSTKEVKPLFAAEQDRSGDDHEWKISQSLENALFVIDEVHEFYVSSTKPMDPAYENFFALHGQYGMDGVLLSQYYRRLHSSVRARIERKNVFQKLTAVGMQNSYTCKRYHGTAPDRYEKVTTDTMKYDPEIFPLYKGYVKDETNTAVYAGGGQTVWRKIAMYSLFMVPVVAFGGYMLHHFFSGGAIIAKRTGSHIGAQPQVITGPSSSSTSAKVDASTVKALAQSSTLHPTYDTKGMPPEVAYVFSLSSQSRPRLLGTMQIDGHLAGIIEWTEEGGHVLERMNLVQLKDAGLTIDNHSYGLKLIYKKATILVTAWPLDLPPPVDNADQSDDGGGRSSKLPHDDLRDRGAASADGSQGRGGRYPERQTDREYQPPEQMQPSPMIEGHVAMGG